MQWGATTSKIPVDSQFDFPVEVRHKYYKGAHFVILRGGWLEICKQDDLAGIANRLPWSSCIYYSRSLLKDACKMWLTWHAVVEGVQYRGSAELVQWTGHWNNQSTDKIQEKMLILEKLYIFKTIFSSIIFNDDK